MAEDSSTEYRGGRIVLVLRYLTPGRRRRSQQDETEVHQITSKSDSLFMTHITLCLRRIEEEIKWNVSGSQKLERHNSWQQAKRKAIF